MTTRRQGIWFLTWNHNHLNRIVFDTGLRHQDGGCGAVHEGVCHRLVIVLVSAVITHNSDQSGIPTLTKKHGTDRGWGGAANLPG